MGHSDISETLNTYTHLRQMMAKTGKINVVIPGFGCEHSAAEMPESALI